MKIRRLHTLFYFLSLMIFSVGSHGQTAASSGEKPQIIKSGTIDCDLVETTPVVFKGEVYRFEYVRQGYWNNKTDDSYFRFVHYETGKPTKSFAKGFHLGSAFVHNEIVYVTAVDIWDGEQVHVFSSNDLENWDGWLAFQLPGYGIFNTSLTWANNNFILMFEIWYKIR